MNTTCEECGDRFEQSRKGRAARFCSASCRALTWRRRGSAASTVDVQPGGNAKALEEQLPMLDGAPVTLVALARGLARQVDAQPANAALSRAYHQVLDDLLAPVTERESREAAAAVAAIRAAGPEEVMSP